MPRILRNYLISFLIIGGILGVVHLIDQYMINKAPEMPKEKMEQPLN